VCFRDALTGASIRSSCVADRTATASQTSFTSVNDDGSWSIQTDDVDGPVSLAFYVVANFNCSGPVELSSYLPSWYQNQPFTGTDPSTALPPSGATQVNPGSSDIVACLAHDTLPTACVAPNTTFSVRVITVGDHPVNQACIAVFDPDNSVTGPGISDADRRWTFTGLPNDTPLVVAVIPPLTTDGPPCQFQGPPPAPGPGQLQPEFYRNIWADLTADPNNPLFQNPYGWATEHGATTITNSATGLNVCLTTDPGSVVPRPSCLPRTPTPTATTSPRPLATQTTLQPNNGPSLADTGGPSAWLLALAASLLTVGTGILSRSTDRGR
jgi:hypothetical protein